MTIRIACLLVACLLVGGCTLTENDRVEPAAVRQQLATRLDETRMAQASAAALWDRLIEGETVACTETIPVPAPITLSEAERTVHPAAAALEGRLNTAIQAVRNAADLWQIECGEERPLVPLDIARAGRDAARAALAPLDDADALLQNWPSAP